MVPDLPGYGRSEPRARPGIPALAETTWRSSTASTLTRPSSSGTRWAAQSAWRWHEARADPWPRLGLPAGGVHNQPMSRALGQLARDVPGANDDVSRRTTGLCQVRATERPASLSLADTLPVAGAAAAHPRPDPCRSIRDPLMPPPERIREVARLAQHLTVAIVEAAHAVNFSHPMELAGVIGVWLDDAVYDGTRLPDGVRVVATK